MAIFKDPIFFIVLFASPKKNQKRSPEIDYTPISRSSSVQQLYYCGFNFGNPTLKFNSPCFYRNPFKLNNATASYLAEGFEVWASEKIALKNLEARSKNEIDVTVAWKYF